VPRIFDNLAAESQLGTHLQRTFKDFQRMDVAVGYFNLRGWRYFDELVREKEAGNGPVVRILIGMVSGGPQEEALTDLQAEVDGTETVDADGSVARERKAMLLEQLKIQLMRGLPTAADRKTLRSLAELLRSGAIEVKVFTRRPLHGKTYVFHRDDLNSPIVGFLGSSNLTAPGLTHNLELNVDVVDSSAAKDLDQWFEDRWNEKFSRPVTGELLELLEESWASTLDREPYDVFLKVCYDMSRDVREGLAEYSVPVEIDTLLLEYQQTAVRTLARRIATRGGAMLGDVVGLGKTLTAIGVALVLRDDGYVPLVICPKNLEGMWNEHFEAFGIHGRVVRYSEAHTVLPNLRPYKLVIIDESHTLRNDTRRDYQAVRDYIQSVDAKALLLTATPYNLRFQDVANQLALYIAPDDDLGISPTIALAKDPGLADKVDQKITTLDAFRRSEEPDDWKRLMSEHLVRRTRSFIENVYAKTDPAGAKYLEFSDGRRFSFPKRKPRPIAHSFGVDDPAAIMASDTTLNTLSALTLPRYRLGEYLARGVVRSADEEKWAEDLARGRGNVAGFVRTTFYKRLSSCGHSYTLSLQRHVARNQLFIHALENNLALPTGTIVDAGDPEGITDDEDLSETEIDPTEVASARVSQRYNALVAANPNGVIWIRPQLFQRQLLERLRNDTTALEALLHSYGTWTPAVDSKLDALIALVRDRHPTEKVLVFTEYKDTADYIARALVEAGIQDVGLATGETSNPTDLVHRFSPVSNAALLEEEPVVVDDELRVLIATDVLSEGQNLQDAHIVVNYDLPWAIIRLIQRAGRVDRIGQLSDEVLIYTFFHEDLDAVLALRQRISERLSANAEAFGSDEQFFGSAEEVKTITDLYAGVMDEADAADDVDASSLAYQYWSEAEQADPARAKRIAALPDLIDATRRRRADGTDAAGVVCYVRTEAGVDGYGRISLDGQTRLLTGHEALTSFYANPGDEAMPLLDDHEELLGALVRGPLATPTAIAGRLRGVRRTIWRRLGESVIRHGDAADAALDLLYQHPLTSDAERRLRRAVASGASDEDLAARLVALNRDDRLVIESRSGNDPVRIVSSMGIAQ
jgi:hypothetical protein